MADAPAPSDSSDRRVNEIIAAYLAAEDAGQSPDRIELLRRHPDLSDQLQAFFDDHHQVERLARRRESSSGAGRQLSKTVGPIDETSTCPPGAPAASRVSEVSWVKDSPMGSKALNLEGYELIEEIARGGMGVVYKARQKRLGRVVALKMILAGQFASPADVQRFRTEAEAVATLDHPNIVPVYHVGDSDGQPYFAMKFIEGGSLVNQLSRYTEDAAAAARLMVVVARAVHHAHQRQILHRDLKPSNILLDREGQPHVTDFGLAKRLDQVAEQTQSGATIGTPPYMAPEQAAGRKHDITTATDVYGLGAILYAMLTGRPPFQATTPLDTMLQVMESRPPAPRQINPAIGRDLETICLKCLEKDPARRYASAEAFAEDLERWLSGRPVKARSVGKAERLWLWCRRSPVAASILGMSATVLISVSVAAVLVAGRLATKLRDGALEGPFYAAQAVSSTVQSRFDSLRTAVQVESRDSRLIASLKATGGNDQTQGFIDEVHEKYREPSGRLTFTNWFVLDAGGTGLASSSKPTDFKGRSFEDRTYFTKARDSEESLAHISPVFKSRIDTRYKFAISAPIRDSDQPALLGVLVAAIATGSDLGVLSDQRHKVALVGLEDPSEAAAGAEPQLLILVHPGYGSDQDGSKCLKLSDGKLRRQIRQLFASSSADRPLQPEEATDDIYQDAVEIGDSVHNDRWLAAFAPVKNTPFCVIVQQRYDEVIGPYRSILFQLGGLTVVLVVAIAASITAWLATRRASR